MSRFLIELARPRSSVISNPHLEERSPKNIFEISSASFLDARGLPVNLLSPAPGSFGLSRRSALAKADLAN
jgi:hypothetical protein